MVDQSRLRIGRDFGIGLEMDERKRQRHDFQEDWKLL